MTSQEPVEAQLRRGAEDDDDLGTRVALSKMLARTFKRDDAVRVGRFVLRERIGGGGMGEVWLARDPRLERDVAIKLLHEGKPEQLRREARALARLNHPGVVEIFEVGEHAGRPYLVMEYLQGQTLREWFDGGPGADAVLDVIEEVAEVLAATHADGLVHRDVKPSNVMRLESGRIKLVDFGIAEVHTTTMSTATSAAPLGISGTLPYMAPEQLAGDRATAATDQFALCVVAWEAITGSVPFDGDDLQSRAKAIAAGPRGGWPGGVSPRVRRVLLRGMANDRSSRHRDVASFGRALARARRGWSWPAWLVGGAGVAAVALAFVSPSGAPTCTELARARMRLAFPDGAGELTRYAESWEEVYIGLCNAAVEEDDGRMICLDDRLGEASAVAERLQAGRVEARVAERTITRLRAPSECERPDTSFIDDVEEEQRAAYRDARTRWYQYFAAEKLGQRAAALPMLEQLHADATELGAPCLLGDIELALGRACMDDGDMPCSKAHLEAALSHAEDCGMGASVLLAASYSMRLYGEMLRDHERAEHFRRYAASALMRYEIPDSPRVVYSNSLAQYLDSMGRPEEAIEHSRDALELLGGLGRPLSEGRQELNLAVILSHAEHHDEAVPRAMHAAERIVDSLPEDDPQLVGMWRNVGAVQAMAGQLDDAFASFQRGYELAQRTLGDEHFHTSGLLHNLGECELDRGSPDRALPWAERALAVRESLAPPGSRWRLETRNLLVRIHREAGRFEEAAEVLRGTAGELESLSPPNADAVCTTLVNLARVELEAGTPERAEATLRRFDAWADSARPELLDLAAELRRELATPPTP